MARDKAHADLAKPRRGWTRVTLPNVPNPWGEVLRGVPSTLGKIEQWCKASNTGKCVQVRYNTWDFKNPDDAMLFTLTWG